METYARYKYKKFGPYDRIGNNWYKVEREFFECYPSGRQNTLILAGCKVKARDCENIQVIK